MRNSLKICHRVQIKSEKDLEIFRMREEHPLPGTPKILMGKSDNNFHEIWTDELRVQPLARLKELNSNLQAFSYAQTVIQACINLAPPHGYFIINENMVFFNPARQLFLWINPDILENHVKIYLPPTPQGEQAMIRSIVSFLKLWLRYDCAQLAQAKTLQELPNKLQPLKAKQFQRFQPQLLNLIQFQSSRRSSVNLQDCKLRRKGGEDSLKLPGQQKLNSDKSNKEIKRTTSPTRDSEQPRFFKGRFSQHCKAVTYSKGEDTSIQLKKTTLVSEQTPEIVNNYENKTFNNMHNFTHSKTSFNHSLGMKKYFPNKTTSNQNKIVRFIQDNDDNPNIFGKNNILLDEEKLREIELQKLNRMKESLHGIGEELNDLFQSGIMDQGTKQINTSFIQKEFKSLLD